jgi:hypothetical protein
MVTSPAAITHVDTEPDLEVEWPDEIPDISTSGKPQTAEPPPVADEPQGVQLPPVGIALSVDHVRVSENTYAFRLRWSNPVGVSPKRPAIYFQWVRADVFDMITEDKQSYGRFKQQIIAEFSQQQKTI